MHTVHLWETWSTLTRAVRKGTSVVTRQVDESFAKWRNAFIAAMHDRAGKIAPTVVGMLDLSGVSRVLDVGGGSGDYSVAFARAKNGLSLAQIRTYWIAWSEADYFVDIWVTSAGRNRDRKRGSKY